LYATDLRDTAARSCGRLTGRGEFAMSGGESRGRILVVGASGQVGTQVLRLLPPGTAIPTSRHAEKPGWMTLDLATVSEADADELVRRFEIAAIYCTGAMTHVDGCESTPELARRINCEGPAILAASAAKRGARFVYFSTDYVFNGQNGPYAEDAPGDPICAYGSSKWQGELAVRDAHPTALVIRTTTVYGPDLNGRNFLYSLRKGLADTKPFRVPADQISTPTYNLDLAAAVVALAESGAQGVFHVAGPDVVSRLEFARRAVVAMGLDPANLLGVSTADLVQIAARPLRGGLLTGKLKAYLPRLRMRGIEDGVSHWMGSGEFQ
jgi:dTDP-4-dehydrorhamnose reductase